MTTLILCNISNFKSAASSVEVPTPGFSMAPRDPPPGFLACERGDQLFHANSGMYDLSPPLPSLALLMFMIDWAFISFCYILPTYLRGRTLDPFFLILSKGIGITSFKESNDQDKFSLRKLLWNTLKRK